MTPALEWDFIAFKMKIISIRKRIVDTGVVNGFMCTRQSVFTRAVIIYVYGRRLCSNWFRHGSTTISNPQCSLTFPHARYLHRYHEHPFGIRAYAMSAVGIAVVSVHSYSHTGS